MKNAPLLIEGTYDGKTVTITYDGEGNPCSMKVSFAPPIQMEIDKGVFKNTRTLSAQLRSELGYEDCCDLLFKHNIPKESGLWALNHDGYPSEHFIRQHWLDRASIRT